VVDYTKKSHKLGDNWTKGVPIEVIPMSYVVAKNNIEKMFGGNAVLRMAKSKVGPLITDNSNFILDWKFPESNNSYDWNDINTKIKLIPGVVETGLFIDMTAKVYFGNADGSVQTSL
jgi:ribose 5-phosphate isomerase A